MMKDNQIEEQYMDSENHFRILGLKEERILLLLSIFRFITFTGGLVIIWFAFGSSLISGSVISLLIAVLFFYLLETYSIHSDRREFYNNLVKINQDEIAALSGDFSAFAPGSEYIDYNHDFSNDVDLFGVSSLFQYINRTVTGYGRDILAGWLSDPCSLSSNLDRRQGALNELAQKVKWRQNFMACGMKKPLEKREIAGFLEWLGDTTSLKPSFSKKILIYFLPVIALISFSLLITGILHYSVFTIIFLVNLLYITIGLKKTNKVHTVLSKKYIYLTSLKDVLRVFENEDFTSGEMNRIKSDISGNDQSASFSVNKLSRLIQAFDSRINMIMGVILNGLFLWDYHCVSRLYKWKNRYNTQFPVWLEMLGEVDAYISLANYAYNNPGFVYPRLADSGIVFSGKNVGHQLIDRKIRVCNDFLINKPGSVCIISGANMAGKSTFLRTIAINFIFAMIGAPVCARELQFTPMRLFTSMRTTDSLSRNESYFYAELKRLRLLKSGIEKGEPLFFILDEILKGTNSADKSMGSKLFLTRMVELRGTGIIATHDISLGELERDYPGSVFNMCFEIEIDGEKIKFDYRLLDGITHNMNAAFLMKQMGILD